MSSTKHKFDDELSDSEIIPLKYVKKKNASKKLKETKLFRDKIGVSERNDDDDQEHEENFSFAQLPHEILLQIFERLNMKEICQMARVCKRWRRAAYDEILWYHLNLGDSCINVRNLHKFFRHQCFKNAKSIRICGNLDKSNKQNKASVTTSLMDKLKESCENMKSLDIRLADLTSINNVFPIGLDELTLQKCELRVDQFKCLTFNSLKSIDLTASTRTCSSHIKDLTKFSSTLNKLVLKKCYRIDDKSVEALVEGNFVNLEHLDLEETNVTSVGVHLICTRLKGMKLKYLNVKMCKNLLDSDKRFLEKTFLIKEFFILEI